MQPFRRLSHLVELHDSLVDELNRAGISNIDVSFPPPPVKGTETIVPITTARALLEEGRVQHNCIAAYIEQVAVRQQVYVYKVLWPERCTLSLRRCGKTWFLSELMLACNQLPSNGTRRVVQRWLNNGISGTSNRPQVAEEQEEVPS